jgi:hypothetical protein
VSFPVTEGLASPALHGSPILSPTGGAAAARQTQSRLEDAPVNDSAGKVLKLLITVLTGLAMSNCCTQPHDLPDCRPTSATSGVQPPSQEVASACVR